MRVIFIPGSVTQGISDAVTGAKGDICVGSTAKPGDVLTSPSGNTGRIKSTSGTSSMCRDARLPIRAEVEFTFSHKSNAGFDLCLSLSLQNSLIFSGITAHF